jgi:hypothetical protein
MISKKSNEKKGMKKHFTEDEQMAKKKKNTWKDVQIIRHQ